eukprot:CAMPEP_0184707234 /NCGR_PEP_ID=MMETSP0313-20130426/37167_1 /TAXON_ID=2792 /ORGANISM="Porphyridium aerugineum, Strain SAG 1380-2" /LENGTH=408 /DNA_ID=CAMNT_0027168809 /DNA_START=1230 /DNA_END=2456 /DNA_ORIENTATION=+
MIVPHLILVAHQSPHASSSSPRTTAANSTAQGNHGSSTIIPTTTPTGTSSNPVPYIVPKHSLINSKVARVELERMQEFARLNASRYSRSTREREGENHTQDIESQGGDLDEIDRDASISPLSMDVMDTDHSPNMNNNMNTNTIANMTKMYGKRMRSRTQPDNHSNSMEQMQMHMDIDQMIEMDEMPNHGEAEGEHGHDEQRNDTMNRANTNTNTNINTHTKSNYSAGLAEVPYHRQQRVRMDDMDTEEPSTNKISKKLSESNSNQTSRSFGMSAEESCSLRSSRIRFGTSKSLHQQKSHSESLSRDDSYSTHSVLTESNDVVIIPEGLRAQYIENLAHGTSSPASSPAQKNRVLDTRINHLTERLNGPEQLSDSVRRELEYSLDKLLSVRKRRQSMTPTNAEKASAAY